MPKIWVLDNPDIGYVKITKVASSSAELALTKYLYCQVEGGDEADIDKKLIRRYADRYAVHLDPRHFTGSKRPGFVFSFVRNPLDRLHSSYINKIVDVRDRGEDHNIFWNHDITLDMQFDEFVRRIIEIPDAKIDRHLRSQASCLWDGSQLITDFVGKFECMADDWAIVADQFGLPKIPHKNKSSKSEAPTPYDKVTARLVAERYRQDIELFQYGDEVDAFISRLS